MTQEGGFNFDLSRRNATLGKKGVEAPRALKTGTTIAGIIFKACFCISDMSYSGGLAPPAKYSTKIHTSCNSSLTVLFSLVFAASSFLPPGWRGSRGGYALDVRLDGGGQKLREDPLHRSQHLLLWSGNGSGH